jgi:hypothetical protein
MLVERPQYRIGGNFVNYGPVLLMKPLSSKLKYTPHTFIHRTGKYDLYGRKKGNNIVLEIRNNCFRKKNKRINCKNQNYIFEQLITKTCIVLWLIKLL